MNLENNLLPNEPVLMPYQSQPFNNDSYVAAEFLKLKEKFNLKNVIELGTCVGGSTKFFAQNFDSVLTVEINSNFRDIALERIKGTNNVMSFLGDSVKWLSIMLQMCDGKIYMPPATMKIIAMDKGETILFIDSHWAEHFPLFDELKVIKETGLKPVIVIHDCKVPNEPELGFDSYGGVDISYENIKPYIEDIYGVDGYDYYYNTAEQSTEIKRGVIYITPKK